MDLQEKYTKLEGWIYIRSLEALVRLSLDQHRKDQQAGLRTATFISGYPGSPLGGFDLTLKRATTHLAKNHVVHLPGVNEELAATAVYGSQIFDLLPGPKYDGVLGMWYGKSPGVDRSGDAFKHANYVGTGKYGGVLVLGGDDHTAKSSTLPCQSDYAYFDAAMPILYPGNTQEILDLGLHGFALSRFSGAWVALKLVTSICDSASTIEVSPDRPSVQKPRFDVDGQPFEKYGEINLTPPRNLILENEVHYRRLEAARRYALANGLNAITVPNPSATLGIITAGKSYYDTRQALTDMGLDDENLQRIGIRILKMGLIYPMEPTVVREFAQGLDEILVIEEKRGFMESQLQGLLYNLKERPRIFGKTDESGEKLFPITGELDADTIAGILAQRLSRSGALPGATKHRLDFLKSQSIHLQAAAVPSRIPNFCSGCPHNTSTVVLEGQMVGAGIGCHTMAIFLGPKANITYVTQMGGEGSPWLGMEPFTDTNHLFQNLGDGTYAHSGSLSLQACIAAEANITFKLLYNDAVAMTGGQPVEAGLGVPALTHKLKSEGVRHLVIVAEDRESYRDRSGLADGVKVYGRDRLMDVQRECEATPGVSVLIYDQRCARMKRSLRKRGLLEDPNRFVMIHEEVCEGCGDCGGKSNCMSVRPVETEFGRKTAIHQSSCNKDYTCIKGDCPSFVTVEPRVHPSVERESRPLPSLEIPEPEAQVSCEEPYAVLLRGIGGTGVVTATALMATATFIEGKCVLSLDQTGLAQMGGAVTSHLLISDRPSEGSSKISAGRANLIFGLDILGLAESRSLKLADPNLTVAIVDSSPTPTAHMIRDTDMWFPHETMLKERINAVTKASENVYVEAGRLTEELLGSHMMTNIFCMGIAYQAGLLPLKAASLEAAIKLNGVAVEENLRAFRWGRTYQMNPEETYAAVFRPTTKTVQQYYREGLDELRQSARSEEIKIYEDLCGRLPDTGDLRRMMTIRLAELILYQNARYARSYFDRVMEACRIEQRKCPGQTALSESIARNLYKLMAYKDEYEVARLLLRTKFQRQVEASFGPKARISFNLHPPVLRALGMKNKIAIPAIWAKLLLGVLRRLKFLRGKPWDPFGSTAIRRQEQELIHWYNLLVEEVLARLRPENYQALVDVAGLPDQIRGYEEIKMASVEKTKASALEQMQKVAEAA